MSVATLTPEQAEIAGDSVGGAHAVAAQLDPGAARALVDASNQAFVDAMATTAGIAAAVALVGAAIALALLPARAARATLALPEPAVA
jgi:DHA2 family multidrug resistance protein-like MFS transporter